jgi:hypothetical protein
MKLLEKFCGNYYKFALKNPYLLDLDLDLGLGSHKN